MMEIIHEQSIGFTSQFPIYHPDGTYLAKVKGNRVYPTADGKKANISIEQPFGKTICKLDNKVLFELTHGVGDDFKANAELYTPDGYFLKCPDSLQPQLFDSKSKSIRIGGNIISGSTFVNCNVGIWLKKDGSCLLGVR